MLRLLACLFDYVNQALHYEGLLPHTFEVLKGCTVANTSSCGGGTGEENEERLFWR